MSYHFECQIDKNKLIISKCKLCFLKILLEIRSFQTFETFVDCVLTALRRLLPLRGFGIAEPFENP